MKLTDAERAHALQHEWIVDRDGDVCIRPMVFTDDGRRELLHYPDPCEFSSLLEAHQTLRALEAEAGYDPDVDEYNGRDE